MSASPEDRGQRGLPPHHQGESSHSTNGVNGGNGGESSSASATVINSIEADDEGSLYRDGAWSPPEAEQRENRRPNLPDNESMRRVFKNILPQVPPSGFHYNSPASVAGTEQDAATDDVAPTNGATTNGASTNGVSGPSVSSPSSASSASHASPPTSQQDHGNQVDGVNGTNGVNGVNGVNGTKSASDRSNAGNSPQASSSTDSSPRSPISQQSHTSSSPGPKNPPDQGGAAGPGGNTDGGNTGQSNNTEDRDRPRGTSTPPDPDSGDQAKEENGDGGGSSETRELQNEENNGTDQDMVTSEHARAPIEPEDNNTRDHQIGNGASSFNGASNRDNEGATAPFNVSRDTSHQPGHITGGFTQPSHINPVLQTPGLTLQTAETARPLSSSSSLNPIAPVFTPRSQQSQEFTLPRWQPDSEVTHCPICGMQFGMFFRKHHCRKCGRVVCDRCSPHRITIPHLYIVRPPGDPGPVSQYAYPGVERGIADFTSIGGGERVRLCNPCVPDPNTAPPQAQHSSRPVVVDGRASRPPSNSLGNYSANTGPPLHHAQPPVHSSNHSRSRSASTSVGRSQEYFSFIPYTSTSSQYPRRNSAYFSQQPPHRRMSSALLRYQQPLDHFGAHGSATPFSALNRPLPRTPTPEPEVSEEDICPVCHRELPSRTLPNWEALRETHINNCITSHSNYGTGQASATGPRNHGTPPPRTTRRTRMFPYVATEKDCAQEAECTICLEEFEVGDQMARLECFCRFHRLCIDSWFVNHPGRCPVHQHDSYGY
ncbi:hypothetical protein F5Y10DRAFT_232986 [Nemania abortiva]|nr:hypothetical protein F5Y10DRAFT_232986 [Nemania abortiva]